ncbi:MAG: hypothetical protein IKD89_08675 [Clostridia bacterium]|nr:hypothetical protein [Clostridia bacterium]
MKENYESVQNGFNIMLTPLAEYIGYKLSAEYKDKWWDVVLDTLSDQRDLPYDGEYSELIDSLDIANCIRLIDRLWGSLFRDLLSQNCRGWAKELMGVRNIVSHIGSQDMEQHTAERALDNMRLIMHEIDKEAERDIKKLYKEVRTRADGQQKMSTADFSEVAQPAPESKRGELAEGSLLRKVGTAVIKKTKQTRKVSYGGKTVVYPVYRIRLDALYYNDQNDRIATWITRYETENGEGSLEGIDRDIYNMVIENFIVDSNPEAIKKTQKNIALVGQQVPGVALADGRIVDGNRRFTCLRRLQRMTTEPLYFETVIMDMDIEADKKQIKLLELAIQHGEEKKVDYDLIDYAIGTYRDVVVTKLLTVAEYAQGTNEPPAEVRKRIEIAGLISEFLDYLKMPEQYHIAREYQVYSLFQELIAPLKQLSDEDKKRLKLIAFNNVLMRSTADQRKLVRDIKKLIQSDGYNAFFDDQMKTIEKIKENYDAADIRTKDDADLFALKNQELSEELEKSMERAMQRVRSRQLKEKPIENAQKSIDLLLEIDPRFFTKLEPDEKEMLRAQLDEIVRIAARFKNMI